MRRAARGRGFTLIEALFSVLIIGVLAGILVVGIRAATSAARSGADTQSAAAIKLGIDNFESLFEIPPPLVKDRGEGSVSNPIAPNGVILIYDEGNATDAQFLRNDPAAAEDLRYSVHSLAYYLVGSLGEKSDGFEGPGMRRVSRDGTFKLSDREKFEPFIDAGKGNFQLFQGADFVKDGKVELRDRNQVPIRYYRWLSGKAYSDAPGQMLVRKPEDLNIPEMVGDATTADADATLRSARWAVVMAGPNKVFGDEPIEELRLALASGAGDPEDKVRADAKADNIVEVGR